MSTLTISEARQKLFKLVDDLSASHEPVTITGKRNNAVLISESDWRVIQETLYLLSIKGMGKSIKKGLNTPLSECSEEIEW
jgi:prevent-host-death family protein